MRIKTTGQINARTQDGRELTADKDETLEIDNEDAALVGLARSLVMSGQAVHAGDAGTLEASPKPEADEKPAGNASREAWADYAKSKAAPEEELAEGGLTRDELRELYG